MLVVCTETTQQVQTQNALRLADARWRALFEQAPGFMCVLEGPEHRFAYANTRFRELVQRQVVVGETVVDLFPDLRKQGFKKKYIWTTEFDLNLAPPGPIKSSRLHTVNLEQRGIRLTDRNQIPKP